MKLKSFKRFNFLLQILLIKYLANFHTINNDLISLRKVDKDIYPDHLHHKYECS